MLELDIDITLPIPMFTHVQEDSRGSHYYHSFHTFDLAMWVQVCGEHMKVSILVSDIRPFDVTRIRPDTSTPEEQNVTSKAPKQRWTFAHVFPLVPSSGHRPGLQVYLPIMALYPNTIAITHATSACTLLFPPHHTVWQCDRRER
jgi:hypothetical protein